MQLLTLGFYALAIAGLWLHRRRKPSSPSIPAVEVEPRELRRVWTVFGLVIGLGFLLSWIREQPGFFVPLALNFVIWIALGFVLSATALGSGVREWITGPSRA